MFSVYRFLVYDRQDHRFKLVPDFDFNEMTRPRVIYEHIVDRRRIEAHTARLWRYAPYALYQFKPDTVFDKDFAGHQEAWAWMQGRIIVSTGPKPSPMERRAWVSELAYFKWLADGCVHGNHERHWREAELQVLHACRDRAEVGTISKPDGFNAHFHAPAVVPETVRKIVIDPRDKTHWVRVADLNFPVEKGTPVRIFGRKHGRFYEEMVVGEFHPGLSYAWKQPVAEMPPSGTGRFITLRPDDLVKYLWTKPGRTRVEPSDPPEGEFYWALEPGQSGVHELVKKVVAAI